MSDDLLQQVGPAREVLSALRRAFEMAVASLARACLSNAVLSNVLLDERQVASFDLAEEVLSQLLGIDGSEFARLHGRGIVA